ncbi:hypothetical protein VitviT2T_019649 [Vitis vinifera]|uniref:Putative plant transposon protein domain-containing protein n=1 Tax=Vitis vinifera TaxID=29760 RepID=A0ABY9D3E1_VITVI|nr:hypothetical protein VitviT2T_019649 [Vitis vinifera]
MPPKRALVEASSPGGKGKSPAVSRMRGTNKKTSDRQQASESTHNTSDGAKRTTNNGKRPAVEASSEVRKKATFDRSTFATPDLAQRFHLHFANRTVIPGRNIAFAKLSYFHFDVLFARMGWLPIVSVNEFVYPKVVKCFYSNMTFEDEGPITTTINGVQIVFYVAALYRILEIPNERVCLYEAKKLPRVEGFKPAEALQRLCGYPRSDRPTSHLLTVLSRILHHMISYIFIPKGGHRDDVSFLEAFLVDSILTERKVNIGYIIFQHMKACSISEDSVLPYGMFITKIVKYFNINLRNETDGKKLKSFDTYDRASLRRMHFVRKKDGSWARKSSVPPSEQFQMMMQAPSLEYTEHKDLDKQWHSPWGSTVVDDVAPAFKTIVEENYLSSSTFHLDDTKENRLQWWTQRKKLDHHRLGKLVRHMGPLKSMKYGSLLKAIYKFSMVHQNYGS